MFYYSSDDPSPLPSIPTDRRVNCPLTYTSTTNGYSGISLISGVDGITGIY